MPSGTTFDPQNLSDFTKGKLNSDHRGILKTILAGEEDFIDFVLTDDEELVGIELKTKGSAFEDNIDAEIMAPDDKGDFTSVLKFATSWGVGESEEAINKRSTFPAKVPAGYKIRITYRSTGITDVKVWLNLMIEKVMV